MKHVCVCVFSKSHIIAQSDLVILLIVILCHQHSRAHVCVCIFIKLHMTAQSGPVCHPSHSMPLALVLPRGVCDVFITLCVCMYVFIGVYCTYYLPVLLNCMCH